MQTVFITDRLDFWTLQFYRRLSCRSPNVKVVSIDPIWMKYANQPEDCIILPKAKIKKFDVAISQPILKKTTYSFDLAKTKSCDLRITPNSRYLVTVLYSRQTSPTAILSMNFYGGDGKRDFEQKHIDLLQDKISHTLETELVTGDFYDDESVYLRLWTSSSETGTAVHIHNVQISKECEIRNEIRKYSSNNTYCFWGEEGSLANWTKTLPITNLSIIDLYKCELEPRKFGSKTYCIREHKNNTKELCHAVQAEHSNPTEDVIFINTDSIVSKKINIHISSETNPKQKTYCLMTPANPVYNLKKTGTKLIEDLDEDPTQFAAVIFNKNINRAVLFKCWESGTATFCTEEVPPDLLNGPIRSVQINRINDIDQIRDNLRELGYVASKSRIPEEIRMDIESLIHFSQLKK